MPLHDIFWLAWLDLHMEIVKYNKQYLNEIITLYIEVFSKEPWNDKWTSENCRTYLLEYINNPVFIVYLLLDNDIIIGCCFGHLKSWYTGKEFYIDEMFVKTEIQNQGLGTKLLNYVENDLRNHDIQRFTLLTMNNSPADKFYMKYGFKENNRLGFKIKNFDVINPPKNVV